MERLKAAWAWAKNHALAIFATFAALLGSLAYALSRKGSGVAPSTSQMRKEAQDIARKEQRATDLEAQADGMAPEAEALKQEILESKRRVMEAQHGPIIKDMDDEQVADLFRRSGL